MQFSHVRTICMGLAWFRFEGTCLFVQVLALGTVAIASCNPVYRARLHYFRNC